MQVKINGVYVNSVIIRKEKKNISFTFKDSMLIISAPNSMSDKEVLHYVKLNESRIHRLLVKLDGKHNPLADLKENVPVKIVGQMYTILYSNKEYPYMEGNYVYLRKGKESNDLMNVAFGELKDYVHKRVVEYYDTMFNDSRYPKVDFNYVKSYFGICYTKERKIYFNMSVAFLDIELIDYLIVHELAHLKYPNHQKQFWDFVIKVIPNAKRLQMVLRRDGFTKC